MTVRACEHKRFMETRINVVKREEQRTRQPEVSNPLSFEATRRNEE